MRIKWKLKKFLKKSQKVIRTNKMKNKSRRIKRLNVLMRMKKMIRIVRMKGEVIYKINNEKMGKINK